MDDQKHGWQWIKNPKMRSKIVDMVKKYAEKAGLDGNAVIEVISQGAAGSWQMSNRYQTMLKDEFEHGFAVDWMRKDLKICLEAGDSNGASLPVTSLVDQFYKDIQKMGGGRWDTSSLFKRLRAIDGLN